MTVTTLKAPEFAKAYPDTDEGKSEYVRSDLLAEQILDWLEREETGYHELAERAGVSPRAISKVLAGESRYQTIFLADRLMMAMGRHVANLDSVFLVPGTGRRPSRCKRK